METNQKYCIRCGTSGVHYSDKHHCNGIAVANAYLFPNGMIAAFDIHGKQMPEYQGKYTKELHAEILNHATPGSSIEGFPDLTTAEALRASLSPFWQLTDLMLANDDELPRDMSDYVDEMEALAKQCQAAKPAILRQLEELSEI